MPQHLGTSSRLHRKFHRAVPFGVWCCLRRKICGTWSLQAARMIRILSGFRTWRRSVSRSQTGPHRPRMRTSLRRATRQSSDTSPQERSPWLVLEPPGHSKHIPLLWSSTTYRNNMECYIRTRMNDAFSRSRGTWWSGMRSTTTLGSSRAVRHSARQWRTQCFNSDTRSTHPLK